MPLPKDARIVVVGSGVFGLSSALHLLDNGYTDISIFDRLDLHSLGYSFQNGADTASSDINKVFRACYDGKEYYHNLALRAREKFIVWDEEVSHLSAEEAREKYNITGKRRIIENCGMLSINNEPELTIDLIESIKEFEHSGLRDTQFDINDEQDLQRAQKLGISDRLDFFKVQDGSHPYFKRITGVFDSTSGVVFASNACLYVNSHLRSRGVKFITGEKGTVDSLIEEDGVVKGIKTSDGLSHLSDLTIMACGPWTASLVPELAGLSEAQNGNVLCIKIPEDRKDLLEKYSPKNFPMTMWRMTELLEHAPFSGFGAFPVTSDGIVKFIMRQKKYTNSTTLNNGAITSVPLTINSNPPAQSLPKEVIGELKDFIKVFFPDLTGFGIHKTQLLWYTDTINNDFIVDFIPDKKGALVVTGGSGHGFKFLPVLGQYVVDVIEGKDSIYTEKFKWRDPTKYEDINGIGEVSSGKRDYRNQLLATERDLVFTEEELSRAVRVN